MLDSLKVIYWAFHNVLCIILWECLGHLYRVYQLYDRQPHNHTNWCMLIAIILITKHSGVARGGGGFGGWSPPLCQLVCTYKLALDCKRLHCNTLYT